MHKEIQDLKLKVNEIIKYINHQAQPDTIELSESDLNRKKLLVQPADLLTTFIDKANGEEEDETPKKKKTPKNREELMDAGVQELKESIGVDDMGEYIEDLIKKDTKKSESPKKKKKKKGSFYY